MEAFKELHKNKKTLFSTVNDILRHHGTYFIEQDEEGKVYTLNYFLNENRVYKVIKGRDDDGFEFNHIPYELDDYVESIYLTTGDILVYETEGEGLVWFTYPKMLIGKKAMDCDDAMGYTEYGSLAQMLEEGLIEKVVLPDYPDPAPQESPAPVKKKRPPKKKNTPPVKAPSAKKRPSSIALSENKPAVEETLPAVPVKGDLILEELLAANPVIEQVLAGMVKDNSICDSNPTTEGSTADDEQEFEEVPDEYGSFETIKKTFDLLKSAIDNVAQISRYSCKNKETGIRTLKVRRGCYHYDYGFRKSHYKEVPEMQLRGFWLEQAGFMRGDFVQVITMKGMMLLVPVQPPPDLEEWE